MQSETAIPIEERVLLLEGSLSESTFSSVRAGLPKSATAKECYFSRYAYADIRLPKIFAVVFDYANPAIAEVVDVNILAVTQQFAIPSNEISDGWKMICWLGDSARRSKLLQSLPTITAWFEGARPIGLCSQETWEARKKLLSALTPRSAAR